MFCAGNQWRRDSGADSGCSRAYDGHTADLPPLEGQQLPVHEAEPQDFLNTVWPARRIPAEPGGTAENLSFLFSKMLRLVHKGEMTLSHMNSDFSLVEATRLPCSSTLLSSGGTWTWFGKQPFKSQTAALPKMIHPSGEEGKAFSWAAASNWKSFQCFSKGPGDPLTLTRNKLVYKLDGWIKKLKFGWLKQLI